MSNKSSGLFEDASKMSVMPKRYVVAIVDHDRTVIKYSFSLAQAETFLWLAKASFRDATKFASLHGERSSELLVGPAIRFCLFDELATKRFAIALRRRQRQR